MFEDRSLIAAQGSSARSKALMLDGRVFLPWTVRFRFSALQTDIRAVFGRVGAKVELQVSRTNIRYKYSSGFDPFVAYVMNGNRVQLPSIYSRGLLDLSLRPAIEREN